MAEHELVRPSRDGDQFHYHWAARHCLALLPGLNSLVAVSIEGASTSEGSSAVDDGDELIDVGFYWGSEALERAQRVEYTQLKHSTRQAETVWTASGLKKTLQGFAKRFTALLLQFVAPDIKSRFRFRFTTNRPIDQKVLEALEDLAASRATRHPSVQATLVGYTGLSGDQAADFFSIFSAEGEEPNLWAQRNLLAQDVGVYLSEADYDAPVQLKELVARKASSEFANDPAIRRHDVLRALRVSEPQLQPAPCLINAPAVVLPREQEAEIRAALLSTTRPIVLHADGGVGKSVIASRLATSMPQGSVAVLYDCFGDGLYRNSLHLRHRHSDALAQIANELAARGLCLPLIPSTHADAKNLMRAFIGRIEQAINLLRARSPEASLCLIVDAADNADMAAEEQGDNPFVRDLISTAVPDGVRLAFTCRTHRRARLGAPSDAHEIELRPFSLAETKAFLRQHYPDATEADVAEFAFLSSSNPRVQALAVEQKLPVSEMLIELGPNQSNVDNAIGELLQRAIDKLKRQAGKTEAAQIDLICQGLAVLRPLVPVSVLAQISGIPESAVRSFALDLGRPLLIKGNSLHFTDEPTETWFRDRFKPAHANLESFLARLRPLASDSSYVASTLPQLMLSAGLMDELVALALSEDGLPATNAIERRDVEIQRLTFALKACLQAGRYADAAKLSMKAGGQVAAATRQTALIQQNSDIAGVLLSPNRIDELVSRRTFGSSWMGSHHAYEAGLLSGRKEFLAEAGSRLRMAMEWLYAWARGPADDRKTVTNSDRAELALARMRVLGPQAAARFLGSWRPRRLAFDAARLLARRLLDLGEYGELDSLALVGTNNFWLSLGIVAEASRMGHRLPPAPLARVMHTLADRRVQIKGSDQWNERWDTLEAVTAAVSMSLRVLPRDDASWSGILRRHLPEKPPTALSDRFGTDISPLLRAYALEAALRNDRLTLLAIAPPDVRSELETRDSYRRGSDTTAFERTTGSLLPWFVLSAEVACGRSPSNLDAAVKDALDKSVASQDYQSRSHVRNVVAIEWIRVLRDASVTTEASVAVLRDWISTHDNHISPDTLTVMCRIASHSPGLSDFAMELAIAAFESLETSREHAETRTDAYQLLARAVLPVNKAEAAAYFGRAVEISDNIGDENLDRWIAMLHLAKASSKKQTPRPQSAYRLARAAELTYRYVYRDKHFDWPTTVEALLGLCPSSTLAILSRWRDRDFGSAERQIEKAIRSLVEASQLPAIATVALAGLDAGLNSLNDIKRAIDAQTDKERKKQILHAAYRYVRVDPQNEETWTGMAQQGRALGVQLPDIDRLLAAAARRYRLASPQPKPSPQHYEGSERDEPDWDTLFAGLELTNQASLRRAYGDLKSFAPPYSIEEFFKQGRVRSGHSRMAAFIRAVASWPDFGIFKFRDLLDAIPPLGFRSLSVREALREATLAACRNTPQYSQRSGWGKVFPSERLYTLGIVTDKDVVTAILQGYAARIDTLDARAFFLLVDPLTSRLTQDEADGALNFGLSLLDGMLRSEDGDGPWREELTPAQSCEQALAGYLWAGLGSPAASERWKTAHAVRTCVELNWNGLLSALAARASAGSPAPFTDEGLIFYEWHARQWLLIALARGVIDRPTAVEPFVPFLTASADEEHVLIRHFAVETLKILRMSGVVPTTTDAAPDEANIRRQPLHVHTRSRSVSDDDDYDDANAPDPPGHEKYYFGIDIGPYWFAPLGQVFGINQESIERRARDVLHDRMASSYGSDLEDARYERKILHYEDTNHSHGTTPRVDDLTAYNSYHAMMIVAARLLETHSVGKAADNTTDDFGEWLEGQLLTRSDGHWLADRRDPHLTEPPPDSRGYRDKTWCWSVTGQHLDRQLLTDDGLHVLWGYWSSGERDNEETVSVRGVLVPQDTATALLAAFQTSPRPDNIYIPATEDREVSIGRFRLEAWVDSSSDPVRLDEYDSWASKVEYPGPRPASAVVDLLGLKAQLDARSWISDAGAFIRSESWTRKVGYEPKEESIAGSRLSCNREFLLAFLKQNPEMRLMLSVSIRRKPPHSSSDQEVFEPYPWPYVRYYLIDKDGIARSLKSRD
ncbi:AVAST type 3 anti-phage nuclease/ATPase Avs3a [Paraburkholderia sp. C35]|uniref:AVAST type 3 anti-phage nuclease/ATPase Avs3a n=1 Tax=Paraburkholderia sp. C35 TaxID=2126993 RepID=UPI000D6923DD|nr:AVAST type 3 anti-phage nuclease/ATPase Avs3a [Paraburkholderia sp. C35]